MIKEAINRILELAPPNVIKIGDHEYADKSLRRVAAPTVQQLQVHTLTAITNYVRELPDGHVLSSDLLIHIENYDSVCLYDCLREDMERVTILRATLNDVSPDFGNWYELESFNILMQSCFVPNEDSANILRLIGNVADDTLKNARDDGVSQQVTVKTGISLVGREVVPNPVSLIPFRTFTEAEQPESRFVFRLKKQGDVITAALFNADGGAWKNDAIANIKAYLESHLPDDRTVNILA